MKDEATAEQLAMARRIAEETRIDGPLGLGPPNAVKAALAAIIETTNRIQRLLDNCGEPCPQCWDAIERGDHLKEQSNAE